MMLPEAELNTNKQKQIKVKIILFIETHMTPVGEWGLKLPLKYTRTYSRAHAVIKSLSHENAKTIVNAQISRVGQ